MKTYLLCFIVAGFILAEVSEAAVYRKATEGNAVVMNKLYPKKKKFELDLDGGEILNQSYIQSFVVHAAGTYFMSEVWGVGVDFVYSINMDKNERKCVETFYNNPNDVAMPVCQSEGGPEDPRSLDDPNAKVWANYGPGYVPIREMKYMIAANVIWTPVYGKQLLLLSATSYFDLFFSFGGGVAMSDYYPQQEILHNGKMSRGRFDTVDRANNPGAEASETDSYGVAGRPPFESKVSPMVCASIGQRYHFGKKFTLKAELKNYMLVATEQGFETFFTLWGGVGIRL